ncbi:uncharacterized protein LOC108344680 isoform X3 [Vigna angularis]|uniref:uncharacterized protein LOC108344680 isoform X3 n=1 Tax=Phaseolus angularis TaxID=3914 RepID=UPI0022B50E9D|nr:uncharacterized protein LOC108344680 isoform X3 [Vigna angularis]
MEEEHQYSESSEELQTQKPDGEDQQLQHQYQLPGAEEKLVLQFMDSVHNYLSLFDKVSSTLRQGWFDLASARHSMGAARINSSLLDLKFHSAATTLKITNYDGTQPCFILRKWASSAEKGIHELEDENIQPQDSSVKSCALETLVEIANMQSSLLYSFHQLQKVEDNKE